MPIFLVCQSAAGDGFGWWVIVSMCKFIVIVTVTVGVKLGSANVHYNGNLSSSRLASPKPSVYPSLVSKNSPSAVLALL